MIPHSAEYDKAVVADSRKQVVRASFILIDPDAVIEKPVSNDESAYSLTNQITNSGMDETAQNIATLEPHRWALDGTFDIEPADKNERIGQVGWESETLSDQNGNFSEPYPYVEYEFENVDLLQNVMLQFSSKEFNGFPVNFLLEFFSGDTPLISMETVGNSETTVIVDDLSLNFPTKMKLTISKWSTPNRRVRVIRMVPFLQEEWDTNTIKTVDVYTEVTFSGLSIPYSTCSVEIYNENNRFDPYAPDSLFQSIEERQAINIGFGLVLQDGTTEWLPAGTYYQKSGGWKLNDLTIRWDLLDIVGMLANKKFVVPEILPTTLAGWVKALVSSMGVNFASKYIVDSNVSSVALTAKKDDVDGKTCGEILRYACMATNTWPRQDMATGKLHVGKLDRMEGNSFTLNNMASYATMKANNDISDITFALDNDAEGNEKSVTFPGTNTNNDTSLSVNNPFVHTEEDARKAVISCLFEYGGKSFTVRSRGNPSSETGDIMSIQTQFGTEVSARLYKQQLKLENGVMRNMPSYLVQSPNDSTYSNKIVLTGSGTWSGPDGVTQIKITVIQGGTGGRGGGGGVMVTEGGWFAQDKTSGGDAGSGGKVLIVELEISENQSFSYSCGEAGKGGAGGVEGVDGTYGTEGDETVFGQYSSAKGKTYSNGIMDIQTGSVYASPGNSTAIGYGCGGVGGKNGEDGYRYYQMDGNIIVDTVVVREPEAGGDGADGKPGCIIVEW